MTVLVTGASAGFGLAICRLFITKGYKVIGSARRIERLEELKQELGAQFYPLQMDVRDQKGVDQAIDSLPKEWQEIELLINNAGLALGLSPADQAYFEDWLTMIQTNVIGLTYLTRKILPQMVEKKTGHIINIGSIAGTYPYPGGNVYGASKAYVKQFTRNLRADLSGKNIRVSNIEPGLCGGTEFSHVRFKGDQKQVEQTYEHVEYLKAEDIAEAVLWVYQQPKHVNINSIEMMPVAQSYSALTIYRDHQKGAE